MSLDTPSRPAEYFLRGIAHSSQHRRSISLIQGQFHPGIALYAKSRRIRFFQDQPLRSLWNRNERPWKIVLPNRG